MICIGRPLQLTNVLESILGQHALSAHAALVEEKYPAENVKCCHDPLVMCHAMPINILFTYFHIFPLDSLGTSAMWRESFLTFSHSDAVTAINHSYHFYHSKLSRLSVSRSDSSSSCSCPAVAWRAHQSAQGSVYSYGMLWQPATAWGDRLRNKMRQMNMNIVVICCDMNAVKQYESYDRMINE